MVDAETRYSRMENDLSLEKRHLETPPILSSPPSDYTHKSATQKHLAQAKSIWTNDEVSD